MQDLAHQAKEPAGGMIRRLVRSNEGVDGKKDGGALQARYRRSVAGHIVFDEHGQVLFVSKSIRLEWGLSSPGCRGTLDHLISRLLFRMPGAAEILIQDVEALMQSSCADDDRPVCADWKPGFFAISAELSRVSELGWNLTLRIDSDLRTMGAEPTDLFRDRLTGAANRAAFEEHLDAALEGVPDQNATVSVFFLDLDRFKSVNDTLGHAVGDRLLKMVCERLQTALGPSDLLGRLGGDEFAIILGEQRSTEEIGGLAARLIDLVGRPYLIEGQVVNVGSSIGIATAPADGTTRTDILRSADLALYHSKNEGRGQWHFFEPMMQTRAEERRMLELDLRKALMLRQFELHYQPQIEVKTQSIIGLEGLLRWRHPKRGLLLPMEFLPLAEEIGLMPSIDEWVVKTACKQAAGWPEEIAVAVNVSAQQFRSSSFAESVEKALRQTGLPGSRLEIELTENVLLRNQEIVGSKLDALRLLGVHVTMDSFGTGLASLSHLLQFPFDKIKIARSVVGDSPSDLKSRAILRAVSAAGQSLGITTLATGVETREHLARVQEEGCKSVQGFFYSTAVPAKDLDPLLAAYTEKIDTTQLQEA